MAHARDIWRGLWRLAVVIAIICSALSVRVYAEAAFDGAYQGSLRTTLRSNADPDCAELNKPFFLLINGNHFGIHWIYEFDVNVATDGSFGISKFVTYPSISFPTGINGRITDDSLEADIGNKYCMAHLSLRRIRPSGQFDGAYIGRRHMVPNGDAACGEDNIAVIIIRGGHFKRSLGQAVDVEVAADGTFAAQNTMNSGSQIQEFTFKGKITGDTLESDFTAPDCGTHLLLTKSK